jgi:hypothetical protein
LLSAKFVPTAVPQRRLMFSLLFLDLAHDAAYCMARAVADLHMI